MRTTTKPYTKHELLNRCFHLRLVTRIPGFRHGRVHVANRVRDFLGLSLMVKV